MANLQDSGRGADFRLNGSRLGAVSGGGDFDLPRLRLFGLRQDHLENSVPGAGMDAVRIDGRREDETAGEGAVEALLPADAVRCDLLLLLLLPAQRERP